MSLIASIKAPQLFDEMIHHKVIANRNFDFQTPRDSVIASISKGIETLLDKQDEENSRKPKQPYQRIASKTISLYASDESLTLTPYAVIHLPTLAQRNWEMPALKKIFLQAARNLDFFPMEYMTYVMTKEPDMNHIISESIAQHQNFGLVCKLSILERFSYEVTHNSLARLNEPEFECYQIPSISQEKIIPLFFIPRLSDASAQKMYEIEAKYAQN
jgi:hypothetical protein